MRAQKKHLRSSSLGVENLGEDNYRGLVQEGSVSKEKDNIVRGKC